MVMTATVWPTKITTIMYWNEFFKRIVLSNNSTLRLSTKNRQQNGYQSLDHLETSKTFLIFLTFRTVFATCLSEEGGGFILKEYSFQIIQNCKRKFEIQPIVRGINYQILRWADLDSLNSCGKHVLMELITSSGTHLRTMGRKMGRKITNNIAVNLVRFQR